MWKAQEKLPKNASHPRAGKSSVPRPLPWQNQEGDPAVLALHPPPPRLPIPVTALKGAFVRAPEPHRWVGASSPPPSPLGWDAFFPRGRRRWPVATRRGLAGRLGNGGLGMKVGGQPHPGTLLGYLPQGLVIPLAAGWHVPSKTRSRAFCWVRAGPRQAWWQCKNHCVPHWCVPGTGCRVGVQVPHIGVSPQGCSTAAPLRCTARQ